MRFSTYLLFPVLALGVASAATAQINTYGLQQLEPGSCCAVAAEEELYFGFATAVGDFDGDGFAEVAIGVMGAAVDGLPKAGKVIVLRGTGQGPTIVGPVHLDEVALGGTPQAHDNLGWALATGDWNADGADDLAIGVPGDNPDAIDSAGGVYVAYGVPGAGGGALFDDEVDYWSYATVNLGGFAHAGDGFGATFAAGDFDGDGGDDLAIGVPNDNVFAGGSAAGSLTILRGGPFGLTPSGGITLTRNSSGVPGVVTDGDELSAALAAGDFDGDGDDELAIGAPGTTLDGVEGLGEIVVLEFELDGGDLAVDSASTWAEGHGIPGAQEPEDRYGHALAAGDFDGDGADDLAIGAPDEDVGALLGSGAVAILEGIGGVGLEANAVLWSQDDVPGHAAHPSDRFGHALAAGDFNRDGRDDLAIGAPGDFHFYNDGGEIEGLAMGSIQVVPGSPGGPALNATQTFEGTPGDPAADDFGTVLATGRLRGTADALIVGSIGWSPDALNNVGRVSVFHSYQIFNDGFAGNSTEIWSDTVP